MLMRLRFALGLLLLFFVTLIWADVAVPPLSQRVTDLTNTLNAEQSTALENKLAAFEAKKGSQIAVLILPTTQPEDIAAFGIRVFDTWKIGRKNIDDGVILIVAKNDRKSRLEVGRGLEGAIPDAVAKRILTETISPHFKNNDFVGGIDAGVNQLIGLIEGEKLPAVSSESLSDWQVTAIIAAIIGFIIGVFVLLKRMVAEVFKRIKNLSQSQKNQQNSSVWDNDRSSRDSWSSDSGSSSGSSDSSSSDFSGGGGESSGGGASDSW